MVGAASCLDTAVEVYQETLAELYDYFIRYPIEKLPKSNQDHIALVAAVAPATLRKLEASRKHEDILHRTMFMGLAQGGAAQSRSASTPSCEAGAATHSDYDEAWILPFLPP